MATSLSFRRPSNSRPSQYRTPSPPRHAIEPLSPLVSSSYRPSWDTKDFGKAPNAIRQIKTHPEPTGNKSEILESSGHREAPSADTRPERWGHSRSGSNIDTLATIALATRGGFTTSSYKAVPGDNSCTDPHAPVNNESAERPLKRARSERSPSPARQKSTARPATSHISSLDSMKNDAELLLNFARPTNFPPQPSFQLAQEPVYNTYEAGHSEPKWASVPPSNSPGGLSNITNNKISTEFFGTSPSTLARMRSRSDGAAVLSRPVMNGYNQGSPSQLYFSGSVLEDEPEGGETLVDREFLTDVNTAELPQRKRPPKSKAHRRSDGVRKTENDESDSANQTSCAACNLVRGPVNSGDDTDVTWVNCDGCNRWFHIVCAGFKSDREIRTVDKFICKECRPVHGPTTFVRKSSRPKTSIDYAGLNQGYVKPSAEAPDHHYIQPIKEGKLTFLPDNFARLPAELVTAEYFEHGLGMTEPVVIPAHLNPHTPSSALGSTTPLHQFTEATNQEEFDAIIESLTNDEDSEEVVDYCQDLLGMVIPDNLTVRAVGDLYGLEERIEVIDVKSQQGQDKRWTMQKWVDYYYDPSFSKTIRNVISLEVSQSPLGRLIRRPKIVRELDLQDAVWPPELKAIGDYPKVQFYCLMSVADCYTDFHIDFGGSSVYYHIIKGKKTFFFIPPKEKHLKKYEEWCNSAAQDTTFLGDQTKECYRVDLSEGDTMLIPSGWIHAVWTPEDSLVIGGNFLTKNNFGMQIKVAQIEKDTKVPRKFRYPFFQKIMWYTAFKYLDDDPLPLNVFESFVRDENFRFHREYPVYYEFGEHANKAEPGSEYYSSRFYSQAELDGLPELAKYLLRTALIAGGYMVDGVTKETRNAVSRSIPKGQGDPIELVVRFGIWVAWKRGNEPAAQWTRPGAISLDTKVDISDKKRRTRPTRRSERHANNEQRRTSMVSDSSKTMQGQGADDGLSASTSVSVSNTDSPAPANRKLSTQDIKLEDDHRTPKSTSRGTNLGPKRVACEPCRKRRIRCRHKADVNGLPILDKPLGSNGSGNRRASDVNTAITTDDDTAANVVELSRDGALPGLTVHGPTTGVNSNSLTFLNSVKKGRNKACDECRKSKRRCIHDETGKVDPIKAQERAKPRTGFTKRSRTSDEFPLSKRYKTGENMDEQPDESYWETRKEDHGITQEVSPKIHRSDGELAESITKSDLEKGSPKSVETAAKMKAEQMLYVSPPANKAEPDAPSQARAVLGPPPPTDSLVSPPTSLLDDLDSVLNADMQADKSLPCPSEQAQGFSLHVNTPASTSPKTPHPTLEATSTSPTSDRPDRIFSSTVEKRDVSAPTEPPAKSTKSSSRPSSSHKSKQSMTKELKQIQTTFEKGSPTNARHISPTSAQKQPKSGKRDHTAFMEAETDEESMKLIKELHEQEFGLRKRSTRG